MDDEEFVEGGYGSVWQTLISLVWNVFDPFPGHQTTPTYWVFVVCMVAFLFFVEVVVINLLRVKRLQTIIRNESAVFRTSNAQLYRDSHCCVNALRFYMTGLP